MVEKWWGSIGFFSPSSSCFSTESCFPAVVRGAATCLADFSGRSCFCHPDPGGTPSLEWASWAIPLPGTPAVHHWKTFTSRYMFTSWKCVLLQRGCGHTHFCLSQVKLSLWQMLWPTTRGEEFRLLHAEQGSRQNRVTQLNKTNIKTRHKLKGGALGQKGGWVPRHDVIQMCILDSSTVLQQWVMRQSRAVPHSPAVFARLLNAVILSC